MLLSNADLLVAVVPCSCWCAGCHWHPDWRVLCNTQGDQGQDQEARQEDNRRVSGDTQTHHRDNHLPADAASLQQVNTQRFDGLSFDNTEMVLSCVHCVVLEIPSGRQRRSSFQVLMWFPHSHHCCPQTKSLLA